MKIGRIEFPDPFIELAPLAGYGDIAFRRLCRDCGASLTVTEMVSVKGLVYGNEKTEFLLGLAPNETPSCVQLFGSDPEYFAKALRLDRLKNFDIIDINMGCPVPKVTKCGEGSALMRDPVRAAEIVRACVENSLGRPVTVKHRLGYTDNNIVAPEFAAHMTEAGAAAITVHGRTTEQGYGGKANWDIIREVALSVPVPVIGNGDILSRAQAVDAIQKYAVSGVAIGRGSLGDPNIFSQTNTALFLSDFAVSGEKNVDLKRRSVRDAIIKHLGYALEYLPESVAVRTMRKHICKYLAGIPGTKELRLKVNTVASADELREIISESL